jgi:hypothetical protein
MRFKQSRILERSNISKILNDSGSEQKQILVSESDTEFELLRQLHSDALSNEVECERAVHG